jgi:hypothetical protein
VPVTAIAALRTIADHVDGKADQAQTYLWGIALAFLLVATAVRAPALGDSAVPAVARSALLACVAVFCLQAIAALATELRVDQALEGERRGGVLGDVDQRLHDHERGDGYAERERDRRLQQRVARG